MTSLRDPVTANALRVLSRDKKKSSFMYLNDTDGLDMSAVYSLSHDFVPEPQTTVLNFMNTTPLISDGKPEVGISYSALRLQMNARLGSLSTITSTKGTIQSASIDQHEFQFNYQCNFVEDTLVIKSYNFLNTDFRIFRVQVDLISVLDMPKEWYVKIPNTRDYQFTALEMTFHRAVVSLDSVSSEAGNVSNVSVVDGRVLFNYLTGPASTDVLTFYSVYDGVTTNDTPVSFLVTDLYPSPTVTGFSSQPTSQSHPTSTTVLFSKAIQSCTISASHGSIATVTGFGTMSLSFIWTTGASASQTLTFNDLLASDGSLDGGTTETITLNGLGVPVSSASWFDSAPLDSSVEYTSQISLGGGLQFIDPIPSVSCSIEGNTFPEGTYIEGGRLYLKISTSDDDQSDAVYTLANVYSSNGGIASSISIALGPKIDTVFTQVSPGSYVVNGKVLHNTITTVKVQFSQSLASPPNVSPHFSLISHSGNTVIYAVTSPTLGLQNYSIGIITSTMGVSTPSATFQMETVALQVISSFRENGAAEELVEMLVDQDYNIIMSMSKAIPLTGDAPTFEGLPVTRSGQYTYTVNYKAMNPIGTREVQLVGARDMDGFVYTIPKNIKFIPLVPFPSTNLLSWYDLNDSSARTMTASNPAVIKNVNDKFGDYQMTANSLSSRIVSEYGRSFYSDSQWTYQLPIDRLASNHTSSFQAATYFVALRVPDIYQNRMLLGFQDKLTTGYLNNFKLIFSDVGRKLEANMNTGTRPQWSPIEFKTWYILQFEYSNNRTITRSRIFNNPISPAFQNGTGLATVDPIHLCFGGGVDIGEVVYFKSTVSNSDADEVCEYLKRKWVPQSIEDVLLADYTTKHRTAVVNTPVTLHLKTYQNISPDLAGTSITFSDATNSLSITDLATSTIEGESYYTFTFQANFQTILGKFTILNSRDINGFVIPSVQNTVLYNVYHASPVSTTGTALAYGAITSRPYAIGVFTDTSLWTWQFWIKQTTMVSPVYLGIVNHFGGIMTQIRGSQMWIRHPGADWQLPPGEHNLSFATPRRVTLVRNINTVRMYVDGKYVYQITNAHHGSYPSDLYVTGSALFAESPYLPLPNTTRTWGVSLWNYIRSDSDILNNHLTNMDHHWPLTENLEDSIDTNPITLSQAGAAAIFSTI